MLKIITVLFNLVVQEDFSFCLYPKLCYHSDVTI